MVTTTITPDTTLYTWDGIDGYIEGMLGNQSALDYQRCGQTVEQFTDWIATEIGESYFLSQYSARKIDDEFQSGELIEFTPAGVYQEIMAMAAREASYQR